MKRFINAISVAVPSYDEAVDYYVGTLGFSVLQDEDRGKGKRRIVVAPSDDCETGIVLARATKAEQRAAIGNQAGGRVFLFLITDDFTRDYREYAEAGVEFLEPPREMEFGVVAIFRDKFGNKWELIEHK